MLECMYVCIHAHQHALRTQQSSQLPSTALLCTQLTNTKHSWQNGTRCRDGVNALWCHSHFVWLVFEGSIPTCTCFHSENFFVTCVYMHVCMYSSVVVLWGNMLGAFHWRKNSLSWSGPGLSSQSFGERAQTGKAKQCCML